MTAIRTTVLTIPSHLFINNPEDQIKSYLGNDIEIIEYNRGRFQTNRQEYLVYVKYKHVDFSPFEIYKVTDVKQLSSGSSQYVATVENIKNKGETFNCVIPKLNVGDYVNIMPRCVPNQNFKYIGVKLEEFSHSFCTLFGNELLTYRGFNIPIPTIKNFEKVKKGKIDIPVTIGKDNYTYNHYELSYFIKNLTPTEIEYSKLSPTELEKELAKNTRGIYILNNFNILYYPNMDYKISPESIHYLVLTLCLDFENSQFLK